MTQQTIEVEGLPEGWKAVAYRKPIVGEFCWEEEQVYKAVASITPCLIIEKIQPRRIVLEDTEEDNVMDGRYYKDQVFMSGKVLIVSQPKIWKEVKE